MSTQKNLLGILFISMIAVLITTSDINAFTSNGGPKFEYKAKNNRIHLDTMYLSDMDDEVKLEVEFINTGDAPLIVRKVDGCCGTRITGWTQKPLRPGEKGTIQVQFRVEPKPHTISRTVEATTNAPGGIKKLKIKGVVTEKEDGSINLY